MHDTDFCDEETIACEFAALQRLRSLNNTHVVRVDSEIGLCRDLELSYYVMLGAGPLFALHSLASLRLVREALHSVHALGFAHGDVCRENMLNIDGAPKLIDPLDLRCEGNKCGSLASEITQDVIQFCEEFLGVAPFHAPPSCWDLMYNYGEKMAQNTREDATPEHPHDFLQRLIELSNSRWIVEFLWES